MNYATIKNNDIANGPGVRVSLFVSGCTHHCKGCFNEVAWDFHYGEPFTQEVAESILDMVGQAHIKGVTLLGGEPFEPQNQPVLLDLLRQIRAKYPEKSIWCFSGYLFDRDILPGKLGDPAITREMISYIDVLVDGPFIQEKKDLTLRFRGSSNQRLINIPASLEKGEIVLWEDWQGNARGLKG